ncbi:TonB-dependent copper receptor [Thermomonas brevis]
MPLFSAPRTARLAAALAVALSVPFAVLAGEPANPAQQATDPQATGPRQLDAVIVVGARPTTPLIFETDPRLPRQPVPASDGADYLRTIPGFAALRNGGSNGDPVLRGMSGSRLNLLNNDGAMPGACPSRMDNAMSYVAPETYDRLVVVKGPQTVLWGPGGSAGTVRFDRDRERFQARETRLSGSLLGASADRHDETFNARLGAPLGYLRVDGNRSRADDYTAGDGGRVPSSWEKWSADAALGWTPGEHALVELSVGRGDGQARYAGRSMDGVRFLRDSIALRVQHDDLPGPFGRLQASLYDNAADHVMDNHTLRTPNPASAMPMPMASNVHRRTRGGRVAVGWDAAAWTGTFGIDGQDSAHRLRRAPGVGAYAALPWTDDARMRNAGLFAESGWTLAPGSKLVGGARLDHARATDLRMRLGMGMASTPNPTRGMARRETLRSGFLRYEHGGDGALQWFAGVGHAERMPDYWELFSPNQFSPSTGPAGAANAFAGVRRERTTQLDLGLQYRGATLDAWANAYAGRIRDYILLRYVPGMTGAIATRASNVRADIHGAEAGLDYRGIPGWVLGGSLAWAWGADRDHHQPLPQMPPLDARLHATWQGARWSLGGMLRGAARQSRVAPGFGNISSRDLGSSPGFAVASLNASLRLGEGASLSAGIDNLFGRHYSEHLNLAGSADFGYPADPVRIAEPGRTLWLKLNLSR